METLLQNAPQMAQKRINRLGFIQCGIHFRLSILHFVKKSPKKAKSQQPLLVRLSLDTVHLVILDEY
jgi:hypothetical protein